MDIGTTTVAALLVDLRSREVVAVRGEHNAQSSYGADVISRIRHETEWRESGAHGSNPLRAAIVGTSPPSCAAFLTKPESRTWTPFPSRATRP
ncbi:MAG: hypothetical protein V8Q84_05355 [Bilophila sp.]